MALRVAAEEAAEALRVDVLTNQQKVLSAESNLLGIERDRLEQWVNLNLALGGAWE